MSELARAYEKAPAFANGFLKAPFKLAISRPGCEFDGELEPTKDYQKVGSDGETLLRRLYDHAAVSGYGDVKAQETKFDAHVRHAREIPASEFSVGPGLVAEVARLWAAHFYPTRVRVEPYKIHLYGPRGHFKAHRDTPQAGLVGTFLVGLGDSTEDAHLQVGDAAYAASPGEWTAFYPDVPHCVTTLARGHRAELAFKVHRADADVDADASVAGCDPAVVRAVQDLVERIPAPFGIMLPRKYCMGTHRLSGPDALLHTCLRRRAGARVDLLPIVIDYCATWAWDDNEPHAVRAGVYPFTGVHVDYLLSRAGLVSRADLEALAWDRVRPFRRHSVYGGKAVARDSDGYDPAKGVDALGWLRNVDKDVPFFCMDVENSTVVWSAEMEEGSEYVGNESRPHYEDSIYLSYALVVQSVEVP